MAHLNTTQLVQHATSFTDRIDQVQRDPAVRKAWMGAGGDVATAFTSVKGAAHETRAAWHRTDTRGGGAAVAAVHA